MCNRRIALFAARLASASVETTSWYDAALASWLVIVSGPRGVSCHPYRNVPNRTRAFQRVPARPSHGSSVCYGARRRVGRKRLLLFLLLYLHASKRAEGRACGRSGGGVTKQGLERWEFLLREAHLVTRETRRAENERKHQQATSQARTLSLPSLFARGHRQ